MLVPGPVRANADANAAIVELGALVDWFPVPTGGWHAGGGAGLGATVVTPRATGERMSSLALMGSLFGGYDWVLGGAWSMGLELVASGATAGRLKDSNGNDTAYRMQPFAISVEWSFLYF